MVPTVCSTFYFAVFFKFQFFNLGRFSLVSPISLFSLKTSRLNKVVFTITTKNACMVV